LPNEQNIVLQFYWWSATIEIWYKWWFYCCHLFSPIRGHL